MKVLLISVLTEKNAIITEELGMCYIAAYLESKGVDVQVINSSRNYLDYEKIYSFSPDIIGFPVYSTTENIIISVCEEIKKIMPKVIIYWGGYWPTQCPEHLMNKHDIIDYIIMGEGEIATYNLVRALENDLPLKEVKSLVYRDNNEIVINDREALIENLDQLPFPKRDLLKNNLLKYAYISTSRGCKANCAFCWHKKFWNANNINQWRGRSPKNIVDEMEYIVSEYNVNRFWFIDDSFEDSETGNIKRMLDISSEIVNRNIDVSYETYMRAEIYKKLSDNDMILLKKSGFVGVIFGIESGNDEDLRLYRKIANVEDNYNCIKFFRKYDIAVDIGFINFNPYSSINKLRENLEFLKKTKFASVLYYLVERCGITDFSSLYNNIVNDGLIIGKDESSQCYSYHYQSSEIEKMSDYLYYKYHANEESTVYFYAKKIGNYIREELKLLNYVKRQFRDNEKVVLSINDSEEKAWKILDDVNNNNAECFEKLIDLAELGWNDIQADCLTEEYWNYNRIKGYAVQLEKIRLSLYVELSHMGVDPKEYFNI